MLRVVTQYHSVVGYSLSPSLLYTLGTVPSECSSSGRTVEFTHLI